MMATRKTVYFSSGLDEILLNHSKQYENFSNYVKLLIRLDIERNLTGVKKESHSSNTKAIPVRSQGIKLDFRDKKKD